MGDLQGEAEGRQEWVAEHRVKVSPPSPATSHPSGMLRGALDMEIPVPAPLGAPPHRTPAPALAPPRSAPPGPALLIPGPATSSAPWA